MPGTVLNTVHVLFHLAIPTASKYGYYYHPEQRRHLRPRNVKWLEQGNTANE